MVREWRDARDSRRRAWLVRVGGTVTRGKSQVRRKWPHSRWRRWRGGIYLRRLAAPPTPTRPHTGCHSTTYRRASTTQHTWWVAARDRAPCCHSEHRGATGAPTKGLCRWAAFAVLCQFATLTLPAKHRHSAGLQSDRRRVHDRLTPLTQPSTRYSTTGHADAAHAKGHRSRRPRAKA